MPSLGQLDEAVRAFMTEYPEHTVTRGRRRHLRPSHRRVRGAGVRGGRDRRRRARVAAGRRDRPRRRVRAADRRQGRRDRAVERLVPGVPRRVRLAVRRGPPHRRQAGARHRLGLRAAHPGARADQPPGARAARRRTEPGRAAGARRRPPVVRRRRPRLPCLCRRRRPPASGRLRRSRAAPAAVDQKGKKAEALNPLLPFVEFVAHHPVGSPVEPPSSRSRRTART